MSLEAMVAVFRSSQATLGARLILLALADHAHDDGSNAHPAVSTLASKALVDERTAQRALRVLEDACEIVRTGATRNGVTIWHLTICTPLALSTGLSTDISQRGDNLPPELGSLIKGRFGRQDATPGVTNCHPPERLPLAVERWIGKHPEIEPALARDIFEDSFHLRDADLDRAVAYHERRRNR